ncbi:hypothetical protein OEA41_003462 [Lepraria neglecta]|uniref:Uncharacterized protein n=1 Tax=Lepraria neglecta TaxID=209136 RepID=A0AAD9Z5Z7_9LECA|nr:hypothetical protein OEA41_003462 [Lepraria neglecta]
MVAMPSTMTGPLKRHAPNDFDDIDTENIDPLMFSSPSKKSRTFDFELTKSDKTPLFALTPSKTPAQYIERSQVAGQKRKAEDSITPNGTQKHQRVAPSSAPTPAGRSPKSKKIGILSRRRMTSSPFTRINPPAFSLEESQTPFSINAALAGTVPTCKSKSTHRKGWHFDIHEDTPEDEMANLMEHSTCTLDISDDESASHKGDKDNKENIPPVDGPAAIGYSSTQITSTRRDMMTDEPRTPLGDLDAQDFYVDGCNASSVIIVPADDVADCANEKATAASNVEEPSPPSRSRANVITEGRECWKEIVAQLAADTTATNNLTLEQEASKQEAADIQIWESASAKGDDEVNALESAADDINGQPQLA